MHHLAAPEEKCAAFLKQKYYVSHEDIQFIGQTLYQGFTDAQPEIHSADGTEQQLVKMERELVNDIRQVQMACLGSKGCKGLSTHLAERQ